VLLAAVACVLLIASTNVANLLTACGTTCQRELSLRAALAGTGLLLRIIAAAAMARAAAQALDFVDPADGPAFAAVAVILLAVAAAAACAPARRAVRVDPMLRCGRLIRAEPARTRTLSPRLTSRDKVL